MIQIRTRTLLAVLLATAPCLVAVPASAQAGMYPMRSCNVPGSPPAGTGPWVMLPTTTTAILNTCAGGGGFGFWFTGAREMERVSASRARLVRPSAGPKAAISIRRMRLWLVARLSGTGSALFTPLEWTSGGAVTPVNTFGPPGGDTLGTPYVTPLFPEDTSMLDVLLYCSGSTPEGCHAADQVPLEIRGVDVTLQENVSPTGTLTGGTLTAAGSQAGVRTLSYSAADQESGVALVEALLGDTVVATANYGADPTQCAYIDFNACPATRDADLAVDTRGVGDGQHTLALRVTDAAGNRRLIPAAAPVQVANGGPVGALNGAGATAPARLSVRFAKTQRPTLTIGYGRAVMLRGRLTAAGGAPIAGAKVEVIERPAASGAATVNRGGATTDRDGRFRYRVPSKASSRSLRFVYRARFGDAKPAADRALRLRVLAAATLRVSLGGVVVRYAGRVLTRPLPRNGKLVHVQGRAPEGGWRTFASRRTTRSGRFSGRYRLRVRRPGVRLQFRVSIPRERSYPFAARTGRPVTRIVR